MNSLREEVKEFFESLHRWHLDVPIVLTTGSALSIGLAAAWWLRRQSSCSGNSSGGPDLSRLIDIVSVDNMAELASCSNVKIKKCAEQILLDRAVRNENLKIILKSCLSSDLKTTKKAVSVISMLVRFPEYKEKLLYVGTPFTLLDCISKMCDGSDYHILLLRCKEAPDFRKVAEDVIFSLSVLLTGDEIGLSEQVYCHDRGFFTDVLANIMCDTYRAVSFSSKTFSVLLMTQVVNGMTSRLHELMIEDQIHVRAAECFLKSLGDKCLAQNSIQIIVTMVTESDKFDSKILREVGQFNIISPLIGCIKSDNAELVYWSLDLVHEFVQKDLFKMELCKQPGIVKTLTSLLKENEACIQAIVLRIFSYLALLNESFQEKLLKFPPLIQHLSISLASGVLNVHHWALVLVHDIARGGRAATEKLLEVNLDLVKNVLPHATSHNYITMRTALETLGFFYPCDNFHEKMFTPGSMKVFTEVSSVTDRDIREWAAAFLVRISMASDEARKTIVTDGCIDPLLQLAAQSDDPSMAWEITRTLVMVGFLDCKLCLALKSGDESSIVVDGKEYSPGKDGLNVVTFDVSNYKFHGASFCLATAKSVQECKKFIAEIPEWQLIFISLQSPKDDVWKGLKKINALVGQLLPDDASIIEEDPFCLVTVKSEIFKSHRSFETGRGCVEMNVEFHSLGALVNMAMLHILVIPLMDVFMGVPAVSNMSKVDELESLTILAQQTSVLQAMVSTPGFLEHLNELIWNFTALSHIQVMENPKKLLHCIGAMKIIHLMSGLKMSHEKLVDRNSVDALVSLLITLSEVVVTGAEEMHLGVFTGSSVPDTIGRVAERCASFSNIYTNDEKGAYIRKRQGETDYSVGEEIREPSKEVDNRHYDILQLSSTEPEESPAPPNMAISAYIVDEEEALATDRGEDSEGGWEEEKDCYCQVEDVAAEEMGNDESDFEEELIPFAFEDEEIEETRRPSTQPESTGQDITRSWRPYTGGSDFYTRPLRSGHSRGRTLSRALSRSLTESSFRVKSPMKNLSTDVETFVEAIQNLTDYVVSTLYHILNGTFGEKVKSTLRTSKAHFLLLALTTCRSESLLEQIRVPVCAVLSQLFSDEPCSTDNLRNVVILTKERATPCITIGNDCLTARNGSWTFESVFASHFVSTNRSYGMKERPRGWYFEVTLLAKGIMQIGWTSNTDGFSVEKGIGVGDMPGSVAFDGLRCKVLNGSPKECKAIDYGKEWEKGDVIGCLLTCDGEVSFWMNGDDFGVVVKGLDVSQRWYPAASLTCSKQCTFTFARSSMKYAPPEWFHTIEEDFLITSGKRSSLSTQQVQPANAAAVYSSTTKQQDVLSTTNADLWSKMLGESARPCTPPIDICRTTPPIENARSMPRVLFPLSYDYESECSTDTLAVYFEVCCRSQLFDTFEIGFASCYNGRDRRSFRVVCSQGEITSCSDDIYDEVQSFQSFEFVGCALLAPSCKLLLIVDGVPSNAILNPPTEEKGLKTEHLIPIICSRHLDINFGESPFRFVEYNSPERRIPMARFQINTFLADEQDLF